MKHERVLEQAVKDGLIGGLQLGGQLGVGELHLLSGHVVAQSGPEVLLEAFCLHLLLGDLTTEEGPGLLFGLIDGRLHDAAAKEGS